MILIKKNKRISSFAWSEIGLIALVLFLTLCSVAVDPSINYIKANRDERVANNVRNEAISNINTDRESNHENRLVTTNHMQLVAAKEAKKEYKAISQQPRQSRYGLNELSTNSVQPTSRLGKKLSKRSDIRYGENCAEISFGERTFRNKNYRFQPFRDVRWPWQIANLVNNHFMNYDQGSQNVHLKNIMNKHDDTMGVSVVYNHKLNRGILVEEFSRRDKMYRYIKRPSRKKMLRYHLYNYHQLYNNQNVNNKVAQQNSVSRVNK